MHPFFPPPGSNPNHPNNGGPQGPPPFPLNQAPPQLQQPMANFPPNPNNFALGMNMLNQNPQLSSMQLGFNQAFQALAAMQLLGQAAQMQQQQGQMQNLNFLGAGQLFANNLVQGFNHMVNNNNPMSNNINNIGQGLNQNPILAPFANNMVQMNQANTSNAGQNYNNNNNTQNNISQARFQNNNQFNHANNQNKFGGARGRGRGRGMQFGRGQGNWREGKMDPKPSDSSSAFSEKRKKRLPLILYDPKEIIEWREARRRNFPTTTNIEKKLAKSENDEAELRRQQMKQVLEKQEELGFEAAEVPTHYLIGSKNKTRYDSNKNTQNSNRFNNKRGRFGGRGRNSNFNNNSRNAPRNNNNYNNRRDFENKIKEPSLLKKLLGAEIKADKQRILHALKFIVLNEFFEDLGENGELEFPEIRINGEEKFEENLEDLEELRDEIENESEDEREKDEKPEEGEITD